MGGVEEVGADAGQESFERAVRAVVSIAVVTVCLKHHCRPSLTAIVYDTKCDRCAHTLYTTGSMIRH